MKHGITLIILACLMGMVTSSLSAQETPLPVNEPTKLERVERLQKVREQREKRHKALRERRSAKKALLESKQMTEEEKKQRLEARKKLIEDRRALLERPQVRRNSGEALTGRNIVNRKLPSKEILEAKLGYIRAQREVRSHQNMHNQRIAILKRILEISAAQDDTRAQKRAEELLEREQVQWRSIRVENARKLSAAKSALTRVEKSAATLPTPTTEATEETP